MEKETTNLKVSDIVGEKLIPGPLKVKLFTEIVINEYGFDEFNSEMIHKFANCYYRLYQVKTRMEKDPKPGLIGFQLNFEPEEKGKWRHHFFGKRKSGNSLQNGLTALSFTAFNIYSEYIYGNPANEESVYRIREYVHNLFR